MPFISSLVLKRTKVVEMITQYLCIYTSQSIYVYSVYIKYIYTFIYSLLLLVEEKNMYIEFII